MSYGPELIWIWSRIFSVYTGRRVQKIDGGDKWCTIALSGGAVFMLSWGPQNYGAALITDEEKKSALAVSKQTPTVANALKSNLLGSELTSVTQINRDRVLKFSFKKTFGAGFSAPRHIILEAMDRYSNLILIDDKNTVIETAKHIYPADNSYRSILPGQKYILPPEFTGLTLEAWLRSPADSNIKNVVGIGRPLLNFIEKMPLDEQKKYVEDYYSDKTPIEKYLPLQIGRYFTLSTVTHGTGGNFNQSIESAGEYLVLAPIFDGAVGSIKKQLTHYIKKEITRRERQISDINRLIYDEDARAYKNYGELIITNLWKIKPGEKEARLASYGEDGAETFCTVPLDPAISASKNAEKYFKKYKKILSSQEHAAILLKKVEEELAVYNEQLSIADALSSAEYLTQIAYELGFVIKTACKDPKKHKAQQGPPHLRFDVEGSIIYVGLSAKGNRHVTFRLANPEDLWFHVQGIPGAHVILRPAPGLSISESTYLINLCASFAVRYSKGNGNNGARVDYTQRKYVTAIKGGVANVTYREFSSVPGDIAICVKFLEENRPVLGAKET